MGRIGEQFSSRKFKGGAYATVISVFVIAVVFVINLIVGDLGITKDYSANGVYSVLDSTKEYVAGLKDKISIYYLAQDGNANPIYERVMEDFNTANKNVQIVQKDPVKNPKFAAEYTDEQIMEHSLIVVNDNNGRSKYISYADTLIQELNYQTYQYETVAFDLEGQLLSALAYVSNEKLPVMYILKGHSEADVSQTLADGIAKENVETKELELLKTGEIPEDCSLLFIYAPQTDLVEEETALISEYMDNGGKVIMIFGIETGDLANLNAFLENYGLRRAEGFILEGDTNYYMMRTPYQIIPDMESHVITDALSKKYPVFIIAQGMKQTDELRDGITVVPLLETSAKAYSKADVNSDVLGQEEGDESGPFMVGAEVIDGEGGMVVFSSSYFLNDSILRLGSYANGDLFYNAINYLAGVDNSVSVRTVSLDEEIITVPASTGNMLAVLYIAFIPILILTIGIIVVVRRRRL